MKKRRRLNSFFGSKMIYFIIVTIISIGAAYYFTGGRLFSSTRLFFVGTTWSMSIWFTQALGNGWIVDRLDERISWLKTPWKRVIIGFTSLVVYSFIAFQVVQTFFEFLIFNQPEGYFNSEEFWENFWVSGRIAVIISLSVSTVLTAVGFFRGWREQAIRAEQLEKEAYIRQYNALKDQLNPHFLFNSLNVLTELVYEDQDQAVSYIRKLSDVYRYVLDSGKQELLSLSQEVQFLENYIGLLKERFGDNLIFENQLSVDHQDAFLVPMTLQLLIENAVKHNVVSRQTPLSIQMKTENDKLIISNSLQLKKNVEHSTGLGLKYLKDRYNQLTQEEMTAGINQSEDTFEVVIPLLKIEG